MSLPAQDWFEEWFDSPFYHILYKNRDDREAGVFLSNLIARLHIAPGSNILDMACGKGRHSIFLNNKGFNVTGIDLSVSSINHANRFANDQLSFFVHDMRRPVRINYFDYVLNLFTSFGYFRNDVENLSVIKSACLSLKSKGILVIDYLNVSKALQHMQELHEKEIDNIHFTITKKLEDNAIKKNISFTAENKRYEYQEYVKAYQLPHFKIFFDKTGFNVLNVFGDYNLGPFIESESDRLIMVVQKIK